VSLERELERLDRRIADVRVAIEVAYATRIPDEKKDVLFDHLDALLRERGYLRLRWANAVARQGIRAAFAKLARKLREIAARFLPELRRLEEARERSRPAFWRGVADSRPRADVRCAFSASLPANRRPMLPGFMKQKGRG
jgi:hypothetical protein